MKENPTDTEYALGPWRDMSGSVEKSKYGTLEEQLADRIALRFASVIREWLNEAELAEVNRLNNLEMSPHVCHTHDFCDANMAMDEAFRKEGLEVNLGDYAFGRIWDAAWNIARVEGFAEREAQ